MAGLVFGYVAQTVVDKPYHLAIFLILSQAAILLLLNTEAILVLQTACIRPLIYQSCRRV